MRKHFSQRSPKGVSECKRHFCRRLAERYGVTLAQGEYEALCAAVRNNKARFLERESLTRTHWILPIHGQDVHVVYEKNTHSLATALPMP